MESDVQALAAVIVVVLVIVAIVIQVRENLTKQCPRCAQRISEKAQVCPFCGHQFSGPRREAQP